MKYVFVFIYMGWQNENLDRTMSFLSSEGVGSTSSSQQQATLSQQQATLSQQQATLSQQQALTSLRKLMPIYEFVAAHGRFNDSKTIVYALTVQFRKKMMGGILNWLFTMLYLYSLFTAALFYVN